MQDSSQLKDYKVQDNGKLMLTRVAKPDLKKILYSHFSKFYDTETSNVLATQFIDNMRQKLKDYSLDDLDKLGEALLREPATS